MASLKQQRANSGAPIVRDPVRWTARLLCSRHQANTADRALAIILTPPAGSRCEAIPPLVDPRPDFDLPNRITEPAPHDDRTDRD